MESFDLVKKFLATEPVKSHCLNKSLITYLEQLFYLCRDELPFFFIQPSLPYNNHKYNNYSSKQLQIMWLKATYKQLLKEYVNQNRAKEVVT